MAFEAPRNKLSAFLGSPYIKPIFLKEARGLFGAHPGQTLAGDSLPWEYAPSTPASGGRVL